MHKLPQLDPLVAFEAAVRLGSFVSAAAEMNVTASAVSQQIRSLEGQLGVALFDRGHKSVTPTTGGLEFYNSVAIALRHLATAAGEVRRAEQDVRLVVAADTSFASDWLLPRLAGFEARYPNVKLHFKVTDVQGDLLTPDVAVGFVHGRGDFGGKEAVKLFGEEVFAVCAPEYLTQWEGQDWAQTRLLDLDYVQWDWMNWAIWLTEMGLEVPASGPVVRMNSYPLLIDAARRGLGVALAWKGLVDDDLINGSLVRVGAGALGTENGYYLVAGEAFGRPEATVFWEWVLQSSQVDYAHR